MKWAKISIETSHEAEDAISNLLVEMDSGGVQIDDDNSDASKVTLSAYFPPDDMIGERVSKLARLLADMREMGMEVGAGRVLVERVDEEKWSEPWKEFFRPMPVGERILVHPSWESVSADGSRDVLIQIDPQMAFGTGRHSTTMLCLDLLEDVINGGERVADVGTGSGVLAIAAIKLGAREAIAIDVDEKAVPIARENARLNGVSDRVHVMCGDRLSFVEAKYDVIVSNIASKVILSMMPNFRSYLSSGGRLILSGILDHEASEIQNEIENHGLKTLETRFHEKWAAILASTPS